MHGKFPLKIGLQPLQKRAGSPAGPSRRGIHERQRHRARIDPFPVFAENLVIEAHLHFRHLGQRHPDRQQIVVESRRHVAALHIDHGQWNALKLLGSRGEFLSDAEGKRVLAIAADDAYDYPGVDALGHVVFRGSYDREHIDRVLALPLVDREAVRRAGFRVVVDAVNSVGGVVMPVLFRELGCEVVEMNCTPDGRFAHTPEPIPENLTDIAARVPSERADLGVVVDPDVDRLALVCEDGTMFGEEYTLVAVADYVLSHTKGPAVSNLSSSRALRDVAERHGCPYCAAAVGEVNVVAKMREVGAVIGGEGNGGVIYPELHYGRDALVGVALFLTHLARTGLSASALRATYPPYFISKNKIELTPDIDVDGVLSAIKAKYAGERVTDIDGVKIDFPAEWVHLRKSNTEPIIRIYSESRDEASAEALARRIMADIREATGR